MSIPRVAWQDLPRAVRSAVEERTGPILGFSDASTGANSSIAVRLSSDSGALFVKGVPVDHPQLSTQAREADINPHLPTSAPRLLWHVRAAGWDLLAFEVIDGRNADFSPGSSDLPLVVAALRELAAVPCPDQPLKTIQQRLAEHSDRPYLFAGEALLHTDIAPHNVLIDAETGGKAHLVDWAWPTRGAAWVDPAVWIIRLIDAGNPPSEAENWAAKLPQWRDAPPSAVMAFAEANVALWEDIAVHSGDDGWQHSMAASARRWADYRIGRSDRTGAGPPP